jgi:hypothetical protein
MERTSEIAVVRRLIQSVRQAIARVAGVQRARTFSSVQPAPIPP